MIQTEVQEYDRDICWKIGQRIQETRLSKGLSGVELSAYLNINKNQMSRIENGKANCTVPQLFILAQLLECSVDYLLFGKQLGESLSLEQRTAIAAVKKAFLWK